MYTPPFNRVDDPAKIHAFLHAHGFATVVTNDGERLCASHLPVLFDDPPSQERLGTVRSHMARANPQWRHFSSEQEVLCIFHGPHAYISPSSYVMQHAVPTWNYAAVHVYGVATIVNELSLKQIVYDTTEKYESVRPEPWTIPLSQHELDGMLKAIVGFSFEITRIEAKFKLGQNRSEADQEKMVAALQGASDCGSRELAAFILQQRNSDA
jgi:transcriptional regulator